MSVVLLVVSVLCAFCTGVHGDSRTEPVVTLGHGGSLKGIAVKTLEGREIYSFLSVPYAKPPLDDLRFKAPRPALPWSGVLDATKDAAICTQRNPYVREKEVSGSEDCLYLSVHTPKVTSKPSELLPVMVFIHGGGFMCGSGISAFYGPNHLLDRDVILVGVNYRLGPLGFLATGDLNCPGNNGMKDQTLALQWVQQNINKFGGDPNSVTLFGESAGGASTDYHMMSDLSTGLFQKGISQSGTSLCFWAVPPKKSEAPKRAERLAEILGCSLADNSGDWGKALDCLRTKPANAVTEAFYDFFEWDLDPMIPFPPVVEPKHDGAFLTEHPRTIMAKGGGWGAKLPWMSGLTNDEGGIKSAPLFGHSLIDELDSDWERISPIMLYFQDTSVSEQKNVARTIRDYYFKDQRMGKSTKANITNMLTDSWFLSGMYETVKGRIERLQEAREECVSGNEVDKCDDFPPTYLYLFAHRGAASFTEIFGDPTDDYGVCHADDLQYLFPVGKDLFPTKKMTPEDLQIVKDITTFWVNFAKTGNPTPGYDSSKQWRPVNLSDRSASEYLEISLKGGMKRDLLTERAEFWLSLPMPILQDGKPILGVKDEL